MQPSQSHNPAGTNGFAFLEFTTLDSERLHQQFTSLGFSIVATHKFRNVKIDQQNFIRFIVNIEKNAIAHDFANLHGSSCSAMGFMVNNAQVAYEHALLSGAKPYVPNIEHDVYNIPAIYGVGNSLIYFVDNINQQENFLENFILVDDTASDKSNSCGLSYIDHVTHNLYRGNMDVWANFYSNLFNFREIRYFDIEGKLTGLKSRAMTSPCGKIRIPLNESSDDYSQIEEFLSDFNGEGIQHIALGSDNIYSSVEQLSNNGIDFLHTPDTYYTLLDKRLPNHGEPVEDLKKYRILMDGNVLQNKQILLQIFTKNMLGPIFFEIIQRKGDEGFGEGNFRALFESIELDQIERGVLKVEGDL